MSKELRSFLKSYKGTKYSEKVYKMFSHLIIEETKISQKSFEKTKENIDSKRAF